MPKAKAVKTPPAPATKSARKRTVAASPTRTKAAAPKGQAKSRRPGGRPDALAAEAVLLTSASSTGAHAAVFQIHFRPDQAAGLDPAFIPLDNASSKDPLHEFAVFERLASAPRMASVPLWGAVSWRFGEKTGMSGADFLRAIEAAPGHDLYFCNPTPQVEAMFGNFWLHGLTRHPSFREATEAVFRANQIDLAELTIIEPSSSFSSCNYFVGSARFWNAYLPFVREFVKRARNGLPPPMLALLDSGAGDPNKLHAESSYWPFIVERLLPLFLRTRGAGLQVHKVALPVPESKLNGHYKRLREMKDVAHRTGSKWLYSCWLHYRNLFLLQTAGKEWCSRHLKAITPEGVHFA